VSRQLVRICSGAMWFRDPFFWRWSTQWYRLKLLFQYPLFLPYDGAVVNNWDFILFTWKRTTNWRRHIVVPYNTYVMITVTSFRDIITMSCSHWSVSRRVGGTPAVAGSNRPHWDFSTLRFFVGFLIAPAKWRNSTLN